METHTPVWKPIRFRLSVRRFEPGMVERHQCASGASCLALAPSASPEASRPIESGGLDVRAPERYDREVGGGLAGCASLSDLSPI